MSNIATASVTVKEELKNALRGIFPGERVIISIIFPNESIIATWVKQGEMGAIIKYNGTLIQIAGKNFQEVLANAKEANARL